MSDIQKELRLKGRVELGDQVILYGGEWMLLKQGDTYIGQSGSDDPEILTMRRLEVQKRRLGVAEGKVFPKERKKPLFNLHEVVKVTIMDNPNPPKETNESGTERAVHSDVGAEVRDPGGAGSPAAPRRNRPVPQAPRRGGPVDYSAAAKQRAAEGAPAGGDRSGGKPRKGSPS